MTAPEKKLAVAIVKRIFQLEDIQYTLSKVCTEILNEMNNESDILVTDALVSLNCRQSDYYDDMIQVKPIKDFVDEEINRLGAAKIISKYRFHNDTLLRRTDMFQVRPIKECYTKMLLNEVRIQDHLLDDPENKQKNSDFEKLCAIFLRVHGKYEGVGVLREVASKDGQLDFFGHRRYEQTDKNPDFIFGQAKRQSGISSQSLNDFLHQFQEGFIPMKEGRESCLGYVLRKGTTIQEKLVQKAPVFLDSTPIPMLICAGGIPPTQNKKLEAFPYYGNSIHGIRFIQQLCISVHKEDKAGFDSWFEDNLPHRFMPDAFDEWLEGQLDSLIIVNK